MSLDLDIANKWFHSSVTSRDDWDAGFLDREIATGKQSIEQEKQREDNRFEQKPGLSKSKIDRFNAVVNDSSNFTEESWSDYSKDNVSACLIPRGGLDSVKRANKDDPSSKTEYANIPKVGMVFQVAPRINEPENFGTYVNKSGKRRGVVSAHICNNKSCANPNHFVFSRAEENMGTSKKETKPTSFIRTLKNTTPEQIEAMATYHHAQTEKHGKKYPSFYTGLLFGFDYSASSGKSIHKRVINDPEAKSRYENDVTRESHRPNLPNFHIPESLFDVENAKIKIDSVSTGEHIPISRALGKTAGSREILYRSVDEHISNEGGGVYQQVDDTVTPTADEPPLPDPVAEEPEEPERKRPKRRLPLTKRRKAVMESQGLNPFR